MPDTDGNGDARCDVSGEPLDGAPKWTITLTPYATFPLAAVPGVRSMLPTAQRGLALGGGLTVEYVDVHFLNPDFDRRKRQPSFFRLKGTIGLGNPAQGWWLGVTAENLTNRATSVLAAETPTGVGHIWQFPEPPRLLYGQFRFSF